MTCARIACLVLLAALLLRAAWGDLRTRIIPNRLNAAIALLAIPWWWASGLAAWPGMASQIAIGGSVLLVFAGLFVAGLIGGGDVKLLAALGLWLSIGQVMTMVVWMAILGGGIALILLIMHKIGRSGARPEVPYGVAIVAATLPIIANTILITPFA